MRRLVVLVLMACAAGAAALALGAVLGAGSTGAGGAGPAAGGHAVHAAAPNAVASPLAGLDRRFRKLRPDAACAAAAAKAKAAARLRAAALRGAAKAKPKALKRKKASMRRAIALLRDGAKLCEAAGGPPPGSPSGGTAPPAPGPAPGPAPTPGPVPVQTITLHVTSGFEFTEDSATAKAGAMRLELVNQSASVQHLVGVRTGPMAPETKSPLASPGQTVSVDVTLAAGSYQLFCDNNDHDLQGMVIPFTVNP
jgi:hypothetical protein